MTLEEAASIVFESSPTRKKYDMPYQEALAIVNQAIKKDPTQKVLLQNKPVPLSTIINSMSEAAKTGLDYNAKMNADRKARREIIAERMKRIRQLHKMTQEEISRIIDWNVLTYRGYENCKSDVPIVILIRLADYYKVSMDYLTGRTDNYKDSPQSNSELEERISKLEEALSNISSAN